jgi:branched-chain amino acid aminotransferase
MSIDEWKEGAASGEITEVFACGTAAVVTPIGQLKAADFTIGSADAAPGELTMSLRQELTDIQYGRVEDRHGWMMRLDSQA